MAETVLVAGASGLVGAACVDAFLEGGDEVIAVSRRRPEVFSERPFRHLPVDLRDGEACRSAFSGLGRVTRVVYAAVHELPGLIPGWVSQEQMETNLAMLRNLMGPLEAAAGGLRHVALMQGTKAYGAHLHPIRVPARERQGRDDHANFYWLQEDDVRERAEAGGWKWTIMRPQLVVGPTYGVVMNLPPVIGAFAALCRATGRPFGFPGGADWVWEAADVRLVASAIRWSGDAPAAADQHFNLTNGEVFSWRDMWPALADALGVEPGPDEPVRMADFLPAHAGVWDEVVRRHGLRPLSMAELLGESHHYADLCFAYGAEQPPPPTYLSTVKIRQAGFGDSYDTEESFVHWLRVLVDRKVLPPAG
ncbi:MAG TPA: SDR family oxidoreductase [Acidimicrobiales bacterium]|nr:SDR family oxidoreductase [Acidimicrobiales bacterium]